MNFLVIDEDHRSKIIIGADGLEELFAKLTDGECRGYSSSYGGAVGHLRVLVQNGRDEEFYDVIVLDTVCLKPHILQAHMEAMVELAHSMGWNTPPENVPLPPGGCYYNNPPRRLGA